MGKSDVPDDAAREPSAPDGMTCGPITGPPDLSSRPDSEVAFNDIDAAQIRIRLEQSLARRQRQSEILAKTIGASNCLFGIFLGGWLTWRSVHHQMLVPGFTGLILAAPFIVGAGLFAGLAMALYRKDWEWAAIFCIFAGGTCALAAISAAFLGLSLHGIVWFLIGACSLLAIPGGIGLVVRNRWGVPWTDVVMKVILIPIFAEVLWIVGNGIIDPLGHIEWTTLQMPLGIAAWSVIVLVCLALVRRT